MIPQGTIVKARTEVYFQVNGKGRQIRIKPTDRLWIGNPPHNQRETGTVEVCRKSQPMGSGYRLSLDHFSAYFDAID